MANRLKLNDMSSQHTDDALGYAFISYVREDCERVDRLQVSLESAGIRVWRDTRDLWPGQDWKMEVRRAITSGDLAFIACFSEHTDRRAATYQNEELILAAQQMRLRKPGQAWLIPVRFAECVTPSYDLGAGRSLDSIQHIDLFDGSWEHELPRLVAAILRVLHAPCPPVGSTTLGPDGRPAAMVAAARPAPQLSREATPWEQEGNSKPWSVDRRTVRQRIAKCWPSSSTVFKMQLFSLAAVAIGPFAAIRISGAVVAVLVAAAGIVRFIVDWRRGQRMALMRDANSVGFAGFLLVLLTGVAIAYAVSPAPSADAMVTVGLVTCAWILAWVTSNAICGILALSRVFKRERGWGLSLVLGITTASTAIGLVLLVVAVAISSYVLLTLGGSAFLVALLADFSSYTNWVTERSAGD